MPDITQRSMTSGEIAPALHARADLAKYATGLATCRNFEVRSQGGAYNRGGTRWVGEVKDSTTRHRLIPFAFSTAQTYVLEFGNLTMRVIKDGGYVVESTTAITGITQANPAVVTDTGHLYANGDKLFLSGIGGMVELNGRSLVIGNVTANTYELTGIDSTGFTAYTSGGTAARVFTLTTPYATADLPFLNFTQSADVMSIARHGFDTYDLTRTAHDAWTITAESFASTVTAPAGLATVAVGTGAGTNNKTYRYVVTTLDANGVESLASAETSITTPSLTTTAGVKITWGAVGGADRYYVYTDPSDNSGVYGFIGESVNAEFTDFNIGPDTSLSPPQDNQPFTGASDKPAAVGYYQQRRIYANTVNAPQDMFATQIGNFVSMRSSTPKKPDDAITFTMNSDQVNAIRHIVALGELILLTSGGGWKVSEGQDFVLTPATIGARRQSGIGSSTVRPVIIGGTVLFVEEEGSTVYVLRKDGASIDLDGTTRFAESDLTVLSDHLFRGFTIEEMSYAAKPNGINWAVRSDGTLLGLTFQQEHKVQGWHRHDTQGTYESVATISENGRSTSYVIVKRSIDGSDVRYVERMEAREETAVEDCFYVDSGLTYDGSAATVISGLHHLEGETVAVLADGNVVRNLVVTDGAITLPLASSKVHIGLGYVSDLETLDVDSAERTLNGYVKSVDNVALQVYQSRGGYVGPDFDNLLEIKPRLDEDFYGAIPLRSWVQEINIEPDWSEGGRVAVRQIDPLPMAILAITPSLDIGG